MSSAGPPGGDVEEHPAVGAAPARLHLAVDRAGHLVAGQQLGRSPAGRVVVVPLVALVLRVGRLRREHRRDVVEHEAVALGVAQHPAVPPDALGDQDAAHRQRPDHPGRMELHRLHVDEVGAGPQGHGMPVTGGLPRVGGVHPALADAAGGHHHRLGLEHHELAGRSPVADHPGHHAVGVVQEAEHLHLHEHLDAVGHRLLLQRTDQLEPGAVPDVGQPGVSVAAEVTLQDQPVLGPVEQGPPLLELADPVGRLLGVELGHPPVVEHLAAAHGVPEVDLPVVLLVDVPEGRGHATFGHHRVGLAQQGLADQRGAQSPGPGLDRRPQPGAAGADDDDVEVVGLVLSHGPLPLRSGIRSRGWCRWPRAARRGR